MQRRTKQILARGLAAVLTGTGLTDAFLRARRKRGDFRVFVIDYHNVIAEEPEPEGSVTGDRLRDHVRFLKSRFEIISLGQAVDLLESGATLDRDYLVITLDDGYVGNHDYALPVFIEEGVTATVFVATGFVEGSPMWTNRSRGLFDLAATRELSAELEAHIESLSPGWRQAEDPAKPLKKIHPEQRNALLDAIESETGRPQGLDEAMSWDQIRALDAAGIEIGCHTVNHPVLPTVSPDEQRREVEDSRDKLAKELGHVPEVFAYPNGDHDPTSVQAVREAGFKAACVTTRGSNVPGCDIYRLRRLGVGAEPVSMLATRFTGLFDARSATPAPEPKQPLVAAMDDAN